MTVFDIFSYGIHHTNLVKIKDWNTLHLSLCRVWENRINGKKGETLKQACSAGHTQNLAGATPPIGNIHQFNKIAAPFESMIQLWCPSGLIIS